MYIQLKVLTGQRKSLIENTGPNRFKVYVKSKPERGLANIEALGLLAQSMKVEKNNLRIISGSNTPNKLVVLK